MERILTQEEIQLGYKSKLKRIIIPPKLYPWLPSRSYFMYIPHKYCADTDSITY